MMRVFSNSIIIISILISISNTAASASPSQIIEVFRHGNRSPVSGYDPTWPASQWGRLTSVGMRQQYILGRVLSEKYPALIQSDYDYNHIYAVSDTTTRCVQSAMAQLYGMYLNSGPALNASYPSELAVPPYQSQLVQDLAHTLPSTEAIPHNNVPNIVNIVDSTNAIIFQGASSIYCPNAPLWIQQNSNDSKIQEGWAMFQDTVNHMNQYLNDDTQRITNVSRLMSFGDTMAANLLENKPLPGNIADPDLIKNISFAITWFSNHIYYGSPLQVQTSLFNLIDAVMKELEAFRKGITYNKVALFSGHDSNLFPILAGFGVINEECLTANFRSYAKNKTLPFPNCYYPTLASNVVFEFYNDTSSPYVKVFYNDDLLKLCNGQDFCSYEDFVAFVKNATGNSTFAIYQQRCGVVKQEEVRLIASEDIKESKLETYSLTLMVLFCGVLAIKLLLNKKKYEKLLNESQENESKEYLFAPEEDNMVMLK